MSQQQASVMQFFAHEFVTSAGAVLFRLSSASQPEICLIHHARKYEWLLPKGRKERGESVQQTALREVFEETGWLAEPFRATMSTRATAPDTDSTKTEQPDIAHLVRGLSSEPFAITIRGDPMQRDVRIIHWFVLCVAGSQAQRVQGTQMEDEDVDEAMFFEAGEAISKLTFEGDRELAQKALEIMTATTSGL